MPCAVGTYFDQANKTCTPCPQGSYQSETGQLQCLRCPNIAGRIGVTAGSGARSAADCKGKLGRRMKINHLIKLVPNYNGKFIFFFVYRTLSAGQIP